MRTFVGRTPNRTLLATMGASNPFAFVAPHVPLPPANPITFAPGSFRCAGKTFVSFRSASMGRVWRCRWVGPLLAAMSMGEWCGREEEREGCLALDA